jgi:hypothetical protein
MDGRPIDREPKRYGEETHARDDDGHDDPLRQDT